MSQVKAATVESIWHGGGSPYAIGSKKFGMWLFIISDALTFSALIMAYTYLRIATPNWWPTPSARAPPRRRSSSTGGSAQ